MDNEELKGLKIKGICLFVRGIPTKEKGNSFYYFFCQLDSIRVLESDLLKIKTHDNKTKL